MDARCMQEARKDKKGEFLKKEFKCHFLKRKGSKRAILKKYVTYRQGF